MYHVIALEDGNINRIQSTHDRTLAKLIAEDYENAAYFDDEDDKVHDQLIEWLQLRGLGREEAERVISRRLEEILSAIGGKKMPPIGSLLEAIAQVLDRIEDEQTPADLSGVIDRFGYRIPREMCGACFICGEIAARHKECMEPGGTKCCPSPMCEACGAVMAEGGTAAQMADNYRIGPLNIIGTLLNIFMRITNSDNRKEFVDWISGILYGGPSIDARMADPEYRPVMAALANALRDRAEIMEKMLKDTGKDTRKENNR